MKCPKCNALIKDESSVCLICVSSVKKDSMRSKDASDTTFKGFGNENKGVFSEARDCLSGNEIACFSLAVVYAVFVFLIRIVNSVNPIIGTILLLVVTSALAIGVATFFLNIARKKEASTNDMFSRFNVVLKATALFYVFTLLLMNAIFIIGLSNANLIIKILLLLPSVFIVTLPFVFVPYILSDYPKLGLFRVLRLSISFMRSNLASYIGVLLISTGLLVAINFVLSFIIPIIASRPVNRNVLLVITSLPAMYVSFLIMTSIAVMYKRSLKRKEDIINIQNSRNKIVETILALLLIIALTSFTVAIAFNVWRNRPINQINFDNILETIVS